MRPLTIIREALSYWQTRPDANRPVAQQHLRAALRSVDKLEVELEQIRRSNASLVALTEAQEERIASMKAALEWKPPARPRPLRPNTDQT